MIGHRLRRPAARLAWGGGAGQRVAPAGGVIAAKVRLVFLVGMVGMVCTAFMLSAAARAMDSGRTHATAEDQATVEWTITSDRWYRFTLNDEPCGSMRITTQTSADGALRRSASELRMRFRRAGSVVSMTLSSWFEETASGQPRQAMSRQAMGDQPVEQHFRFDTEDRNRVTVRSTQDGRSRESTLTLAPDGWLTPLVADRVAASRRSANSREFTVTTVDLSAGIQVVERRARLSGERRARLGDREIPVTVWEVTDSLNQVPSVEEWSSDGVLMRSVLVMPLGRVEATLVEKAEADAALKGAAAEVMVSTLVRPDRPIRDASGVAMARFRIRTIDGAAIELPESGAQRVSRLAPDQVEVTVDERLASPPSEEDRLSERYRRASVMIDSDDEAIQSLATRTLRSLRQADDERRVEALRSAVYRHIRRKGLDSAFATASETVRSRSGDCTEHAVLLAALLRAEGIPARVVMGLVYCQEFAGERDVFGWHMWTQALLERGWVDFDATLPAGLAFHGGHIASGVSALEHGAVDSEWVNLLGLLGNLQIEVIETERRDGRRSP